MGETERKEEQGKKYIMSELVITDGGTPQPGRDVKESSCLIEGV